MTTLSIVIPVFNEERTVLPLIESVKKLDLRRLKMHKEVIVIDDGSTDGTSKALARYVKSATVRVFSHPVNMGKGAALRTGFRAAEGDFVLVQDADLEYDPEECVKMLRPLVEGKADVVFGSRFSGGEPHRVLYFWHAMGNKMLTFLSNMFTDLNLSDMETGYKLFRAGILRRIELKENRFGFEPEITAKVARLAKRRQCRVYEVGISYSGRTYAEGKKIGWKDGFVALRCILRYNLFP